MDLGENTLSCGANLEWLNAIGSIQRKITHKNALLRLIRNEFRDMLLEVSGEKAGNVKLQLKGIIVHKKFMSEGKASIKFPDIKCTLFISNAPPGKLLNFLKTIYVKITGELDRTPTSRKSLRTQLLSGKPQTTEEISPLTIADINKAKAKLTQPTTPTTPISRKRKLPTDKNTKAPFAKKLYTPTDCPQSLNPDQQRVLNACLAGQNVFFTGSAGTGKSFLLKKIIGALAPTDTVATASTGVAACHIGGVTLHAFAGIGTGDANLERCHQLVSRPAIAQIWRRCKHLIIDEISMVEGTFFEKIEAVARFVRNNDKPFGGIQLILCGDFLQLPPVVKQYGGSQGNKLRFCFQTSAWDRCVQSSYELRQVHRQSDPTFINILNSIRIGQVTAEIERKLLATSTQTIEENGILATQLCSHMKDADMINERKLEALSGVVKTFDAQDSDSTITKQLDQQTPVVSKITLKIGAQVMLLKNVNITNGLVNGARGIVVKFSDGLPLVRFRNNREYLAKPERWLIKTPSGVLMSRKQVPLRLAWAFSIHKSQGLTLDCVEMSLARVFEAGQAYVALSRAQSLNSLRVIDFKAKQVWANPDVLEFYRKFRRRLEQTEIIPLGKPQKRTMSAYL